MRPQHGRSWLGRLLNQISFLAVTVASIAMLKYRRCLQAKPCVPQLSGPCLFSPSCNSRVCGPFISCFLLCGVNVNKLHFDLSTLFILKDNRDCECTVHRLLGLFTVPSLSFVCGGRREKRKGFRNLAVSSFSICKDGKGLLVLWCARALGWVGVGTSTGCKGLLLKCNGSVDIYRRAQ